MSSKTGIQNSRGAKILMAHIIRQAYDDLYRLETRHEARAFFLSDDCRVYCQALGYNPEKIMGIAYGGRK